MNQTTNTNLPIKVPSGLPPTDIIIDNHQDLSTKLSQTELDQLQTLPIETLDTIRSKLVQLIDAVTTFRFQLESSPLTPHSLPYPTLISKFLILLNHTEALSQALNTPISTKPINRFELPQARLEREERSKWEDGPGKRSMIGNLAVVPRGLEGLDDGKDWIIGVLTRTKLAPEIEKVEQELLDLLPPPPSTDSTAPTISSLLNHVKNLTSTHEQHITNCRRALHQVRYQSSNAPDLKPSGTREALGGEEVWEWKMRVEVDEALKSSQPDPIMGLPTENPMIKGLLGFMRDGRSPLNHAVDGV